MLVRATGSIPALERALERPGLPTAAIGGRGYWSRQEVRDVLSPGCARSPTRATRRRCTALGLAARRRLARRRRARRARGARARGHDAVERPARAGRPARRRCPPGDADGARRPSRERLVAERERAPRTAARRAASLRAATQPATTCTCCALPGGARRLANVHKLARLAATYEAAAGATCAASSTSPSPRWRPTRARPTRRSSSADLDAVRLMTIHARQGPRVRGRRGRRPRAPGRHDCARPARRGDEAGLRVTTLEPGPSEPALEYQRLADEAQPRRRRGGAPRPLRRDDARRAPADPQRQRRPRRSGREPKPGAPPISWVGPAFVPGVAGLLAADEPAVQDLVPTRAGPRASASSATRRATVGDGAAARARWRRVHEPPGDGAGAPAPVPAPAARGRAAARRRLEPQLLRAVAVRRVRLPLLPRARAAPRAGGRAARPRARRGRAWRARTRGSIVHSLLEHLDFARARAAPADDAVAAAAALHGARVWPAATAGDPRARRGLRREPRRARGSPRRATSAASTASRSPSADPADPAPLVTGVVDVRAQEDGRTRRRRLQDRPPRAPAPTSRRRVARDYGVQRRIYALAELRAARRRWRSSTSSSSAPDEPVAATYAQADAGRARRRAAGAAGEGIAAGALPGLGRAAPRPVPTCPGRRALCVHPEELTLRETPGPAGAAASGTAGPPGPP